MNIITAGVGQGALTIVRHASEATIVDSRVPPAARWGLIPFLTKDLSEIKGLSTINAQAETIATARSWREPFKKRRCVVPVSAFYEWDKKGDKKPYTIDVAKGGMFAFAGLWDAWKDPKTYAPRRPSFCRLSSHPSVRCRWTR